MVSHKEVQIFDAIYHNAIVVDQILAVEEIIGCQQEIPRQTTEPWQTMNAIHLISNRNNLLEAFHLHQKSLEKEKKKPIKFNHQSVCKNPLDYRYHQCQRSAIDD